MTSNILMETHPPTDPAVTCQTINGDVTPRRFPTPNMFSSAFHPQVDSDTEEGIPLMSICPEKYTTRHDDNDQPLCNGNAKNDRATDRLRLSSEGSDQSSIGHGPGMVRVGSWPNSLETSYPSSSSHSGDEEVLLKPRQSEWLDHNAMLSVKGLDNPSTNCKDCSDLNSFHEQRCLSIDIDEHCAGIESDGRSLAQESWNRSSVSTFSKPDTASSKCANSSSNFPLIPKTTEPVQAHATNAQPRQAHWGNRIAQIPRCPIPDHFGAVTVVYPTPQGQDLRDNRNLQEQTALHAASHLPPPRPSTSPWQFAATTPESTPLQKQLPPSHPSPNLPHTSNPTGTVSYTGNDLDIPDSFIDDPFSDSPFCGYRNACGEDTAADASTAVQNQNQNRNQHQNQSPTQFSPTPTPNGDSPNHDAITPTNDVAAWRASPEMLSNQSPALLLTAAQLNTVTRMQSNAHPSSDQPCGNQLQQSSAENTQNAPPAMTETAQTVHVAAGANWPERLDSNSDNCYHNSSQAAPPGQLMTTAETRPGEHMPQIVGTAQAMSHAPLISPAQLISPSQMRPGQHGLHSTQDDVMPSSHDTLPARYVTASQHGLQPPLRVMPTGQTIHPDQVMARHPVCDPANPYYDAHSPLTPVVSQSQGQASSANLCRDGCSYGVDSAPLISQTRHQAQVQVKAIDQQMPGSLPDSSLQAGACSHPSSSCDSCNEECTFRPGDVIRVREDSLKPDFLPTRRTSPNGHKHEQGASRSDSGEEGKPDLSCPGSFSFCCAAGHVFDCGLQNHHTPDYKTFCLMAILLNPVIGILALLTNALAKRYHRRRQYNYSQNLYLLTIVLVSVAVYSAITLIFVITTALKKSPTLPPSPFTSDGSSDCGFVLMKNGTVFDYGRVDNSLLCHHMDEEGFSKALERFLADYPNINSLPTSDNHQSANGHVEVAADISNNAADISDNAGNISNNAGNISNNAGNISNNAGNISDNAGNISNNAGNISNNAGNISNNAADRLGKLESDQTRPVGLENATRENETRPADLENATRENETRPADLQNATPENETRPADLQNATPENETRPADLQNATRENETRPADLENATRENNTRSANGNASGQLRSVPAWPLPSEHNATEPARPSPSERNATEPARPSQSEHNATEPARPSPSKHNATEPARPSPSERNATDVQPTTSPYAAHPTQIEAVNTRLDPEPEVERPTTTTRSTNAETPTLRRQTRSSGDNVEALRLTSKPVTMKMPATMKRPASPSTPRSRRKRWDCLRKRRVRPVKGSAGRIDEE